MLHVWICIHSRRGSYFIKKLKANRHYIDTMYAEFVACYEATGQVNWLKKFIPGLKVVDDIYRPLKLYCDNNLAVQYAHNNKSSGAAKHIDIKYYVVKDKVRDYVISLEHISIEKMHADPLTKGLPPNVFREHLAGMGLCNTLGVTLYSFC